MQKFFKNKTQDKKIIPVTKRQKKAYLKIKKSTNHLNKVYIANLNHTTTSNRMLEYFSKFGHIINHSLIKDKNTQLPQGHGFIQYTDIIMVDRLFANRPHVLDNHEIDIYRDTNNNHNGIKKEDRYKKIFKLFIKGIDSRLINKNDLKKFFQQYGTILNIHIPKDKETNQSRDFGFISFKDYDSVDRVVLNKTLLVNGVVLSVKKAFSNDISDDITIGKSTGAKRVGQSSLVTIKEYDVSALMNELLFKNSTVRNFPDYLTKIN